MPYFGGKLHERYGEKEYFYDHIIESETLEEAEKIYDQYAKEFYPDEDVEEWNGAYEFYGGEIIVEVESVYPTTKQEWMEDLFNLYLIHGKEVNNV